MDNEQTADPRRRGPLGPHAAPARVRRRRRERSGQAMVELALVFPLLITLAISIFDYGYYIEHVNNVATVVRDGARYASMSAPQPSSEPWSSYCADPSWDSSTGAYSCPSASYAVTVSGTFSPTECPGAGPPPCTVVPLSGAVPIAFPSGSSLIIQGSSGTELTLSAAAAVGATTLDIVAYTASSTWTDPTLVWSPPSTNIEALLQQEAESLTVPEGGLPLDNVDCYWISATSAGTPSYDGTPYLPSAFPSGSGLTGQPVSCISVAYYQSSDGSDSPASLSGGLVGWWSADNGCFTAAGGSCTSTLPVAGDVVQVTVMYDWSAVSPGPAFTVLNSLFGLRVVITSQYAMVIQ